MDEKKVLDVLKPKAASLGFTQDELKGIAKNLADNLTLKEDATEEETNEAITKAVDGVLPILKTTQSAVNRIVESKRKEEKPKEEKPKEEKPKEEDGEPAWFKTYREAQEARLNAIEQGNKAEGYAKKAKERFKDIDPEFSEMALEGKSFKDDDEFETFATNLEAKWQGYQQKLADRGLKVAAKPTKGGGKQDEELPDALKERIKANEAEKEAPIMGL